MVSDTRAPAARRFFSPSGLLSRWHPGYEYRPGQLEMAEAVEAALADRKHLVVEAGTGTGKTLAYLVPAILAGRRVVVSTGTKNLQEQIFFKDIPFLAAHLDKPLNVCYMKGRGNYACRQRIYDAEKEPVLSGLEEVADFQVIREWEKTTRTGDRAEIRTLPEASTAWPKIDARRDLCTGQKCPQFERCFLTLMRQRALESDIVIVNHHLFFADLAVRRDDFGGIIPEYSAVIFDEAHELEDIAGQYFGVGVSSYQFQELRRDTSVVAARKGLASADLDYVLESLHNRAQVFFAAFPEQEGRCGFRSQAAFLKSHGDKYEAVRRSLELLVAHLEQNREAADELIPLARRAGELNDALRFFMESGDEGFVYWVERRGRGCFLQATPIDVAGLLEERLFDRVETTVLTSATLAVAGGFDYVRRRLGLRQARTLAVDGHFNYAEQALLYVPEHLPDPRAAAFTAAAAEEILRLLDVSRGRAFVLFTSHQQMRAVHDRVAYRIEHPVLLQGTGPRTALLDEFRSTPNCVLFATSSFWQGVDVPGEQLSCVIIDKLPFAAPSDPVVEARIRFIRERGGDAFDDYQVPEATLALKQGFGRLIRSRSDRGVLALLDHRITRQRYGKAFLESLPPYRFTTDIREVERFFDV